jgi:hypothetical protein
MSSNPNSLALGKIDEEERIIQAALMAIQAKGLKPNGNPKYSFRQAAQDFGIPNRYLTISRRFHGKNTHSLAAESQQCLSYTQETQLVDWIKEMGRRGLPMTPALIIEYASEIHGKRLGEKWLRLFRKRNPDLKARWASGLEACRAQAVNRTVVSEFYDILQELVETYQIPPENIYNMDEKGIQLGIGKRVKVLVDRDQKTVQRIEDGSRELVTILETVCADGTALPPGFIFKGVLRDLEWGRNNPLDAS